MVSVDADVFGGFDERGQDHLYDFAVSTGAMKGERKENLELTILGELPSAGFEHIDRACALTVGNQGGPQAHERPREFRGRKTEGDGFFIERHGLGGFTRNIMRPGDLVDDLGDVGITGVEFFEQPEHVLDLPAMARAYDGVEFGFPVGHVT